MAGTGHPSRDGAVELVAHVQRVRACASCDVTWRGDATTTCWFCGSPGVETGHTRVVREDESAA